MLIKKAYQGEFRHLLSILRLAAADGRKFVAFSKNKFCYKEILNIMQFSGFIESYESRSEIVIIALKQTYWKSFQEPVKAFSTVEAFPVPKAGAISCKRLFKHSRLKGQSALVIISTDSGIISGSSAASKTTGGLPLFTIY